MKFSIQAQISEVERELALRRGVYPRLVSSKKMKEAEADYHMERLHAVLQTLKWFEKNGDRIKELLAKEGTDETASEREDGGGIGGGGRDGGEPSPGAGAS